MAHVRKKQLNFQNTLKDYFSLSYRVKRGLMVLFVLITIEIIALVWLHYFPITSKRVDFTAFKKEVDAFYASAKNSNDSLNDENGFTEATDKKFREKEISHPAKSELFFFNPNQLSEADWQRMGFSEKQIHSIKNYESKGGIFRSKEDVKKMYAISETEFNRIAPYINIPEEKKPEQPEHKKIVRTFLTVDIGIADTTELSTLPMVGDYLAYKIYSYREKLGGFYSINQVKEVYGLRDSAYQVMLPHLILGNPANLKMINLNTSDFAELSKHPYIKSKIAGVIVAYRKQHGPFKDISELQKVALVDAELYRKIAPYLKVE